MNNKTIIKCAKQELNHYKGLSKDLIRIEGLSKIRRYGRGYYNTHIEKTNVISDFSRTFVYLKFMEDTLSEFIEDGC